MSADIFWVSRCYERKPTSDQRWLCPASLWSQVWLVRTEQLWQALKYDPACHIDGSLILFHSQNSTHMLYQHRSNCTQVWISEVLEHHGSLIYFASRALNWVSLKKGYVKIQNTISIFIFATNGVFIMQLYMIRGILW